MHVANRLGANSLLDLVVFGRQADFLEHSWHSGIATVTPIRMEHDGTVIYHELIRIFSEVSIPIANNISIYIIINIYFIQLYIYIYIDMMSFPRKILQVILWIEEILHQLGWLKP